MRGIVLEQKTAIRLSHVTKTFGKVVANNDVSLEIRHGEILSLLGENGSGKTTISEAILDYKSDDKKFKKTEFLTVDDKCIELQKKDI